MVTNPKMLSWVNPTTATAANGNTVSWNANTSLAGIEIDFDNQPAVSVPLSLGATNFNLQSLAAYETLSTGPHNVAIAVVTTGGTVGVLSNIVPFQIDVTPQAPTSVVLA